MASPVTIPDYYKILQINPSASPAEIKSAYRKLAHIYHPDKNAGDKNNSAYFNLLKEAYETLTRPALKQQYLQQRWLAKSMAQPFCTGLSTPQHILQQVLHAAAYISRCDVHRMNKEGLYKQMREILSPTAIDILNNYNEHSVNDAIVQQCLQITGNFTVTHQRQLLGLLVTINSNYAAKIIQRQHQLRQTLKWQKWKPIFVILLLLFLCLLIWRAG